MRQALLVLVIVAVACAAHAQRPTPCGTTRWPHWSRYVEAFISPDGRVIERTAADRTTSEGEAYALFFALVAGDHPLFDRLLKWTQENLAQGDLKQHLPGWNWGKRRDGNWGVIDENSASDADLWMAYALLEAGRLWSESRYAELARNILSNVVAREISDLAGLGPMLLPGPAGFVLGGDRGVRLNPSYVPPQVLRRFSSAGVPGPWNAVLSSSTRTLRETARGGVVPDWVLYRPRRGFAADPMHGSVGSYDAIRAYLWTGMLSEQDEAAVELARALSGLLRRFQENGKLPERIDVFSGRAGGGAPVGFYAALMPLARAASDERSLKALQDRVASQEKNGLYGDPPAYYDQNLILFARGFLDGRFQFDADGALHTAWETQCLGRTR
ncbi:MAG TPA: cellulose synthase complex periplasmic endoglucanase BcsZ [Myxococcales bacterium]|jgi:endoglucanase|nr:cellulose synthase complex periplasmic endoglucanase BcsZ [Myxococcales bacterium]